MIDSGAQLNVISEAMLTTFDYVNIDTQAESVKAFSGAQCQVVKWVEAAIQLNNYKKIITEFAVISNIETSIILGLPFLQQIKGCIDHRNRIITMEEGPIQILEGKRIIPSLSTIEEDNPNNQINLLDLNDLAMPRLTTHQRQKVLELLTEFEGLWKGKRMGLVRDICHHICLDTTRPIVSRPRRMNPEQQEAIDTEVKKMLEDGVIRHSNSPYASEVVMVRKPNGNWRVCIDYRLVNDHTIPDNYPFPRISDLLRAIKDATFLVAIDLRSGYWQIPMAEESKPITAFRTSKGLYEFEVMPFGLSNAPATFQRTMDFLLGDLYSKRSVVYIDDILLFERDFESTLALLREVFKRLDSVGFTINLEKSNFFEMEVEYLGHIIGQGQLKPNPKRVEILRHLRPATTTKELRRILGLFVYYQIYVHQFAATVVPLTDALKGNLKSSARVTWTDAMQEAVDKVVTQIQGAVLAMPLDSDKFLLETDASDVAIAGILSVYRISRWEPVEFVSKKLGGAQLNWPTREKEAYAIIYCLGKFDQYLRSRKFTIHTDHQSLIWLKAARTGKIARWAVRLGEYDMDIYWKKGTELVHVDCLTRQLDFDEELQPRMVYSVTVDPHPLPDMQTIIREQGGTAPPGRGFVQSGSIIYYRNGVWVPPKFRKMVIAACHTLPPYCHPGVKRTRSNILKVFNWEGVHEDVTQYVRGCIVCQRSRPGVERLQGLLQTHPIPKAFEVVYLDFWHCTYQRQKKVVLTMVDQATKWVEAVPLLSQTSETVASIVLQTWVCRFGVPRTLVTDNDPPLIGGALTRLAAQLGIQKLRTTPYHPQGNAPIESFHKTLNRRIPIFENRSRSENIPFEIALQLVLWSYRAVIHSTMGESPAYLVYGVDPRPPLENDWRMIERVPEQERVKFLNIMRDDLQYRAFQRLHFRNSIQERVDTEINEGDLILVRKQPNEIGQMSTRDGTALKLVPRWGLPSRIIKRGHNSNRLFVRELLTGREREVHVTDVRLIARPQDEYQRQDWTDMALEALEKGAYDQAEREKVLQRFWEEVDSPQVKRQCTRISEGEGDRPMSR
jgi:RNase H-like domain found in reverse transcriptase/Reverse transcriptase (RNA-dependent DNA polymerase)/Integrase zinc binding domain/Integrase core domain